MDKNKKKKYRTKLPDENVEYTFIFPGDIYRTYVYKGLTDTDRVIVMNVKTKNYSNYSRGYFAGMMKRQLISKKPVEASEIKPEQVKKQANETLSDFEERMISELRSLTPALTLSVISCIGYSPEKLADDLERLKNTNTEYTQEYINRVFGDLIKARDIIFNIKSDLKVI